jgi:small subunit ribosomal protein S13
LARIAGVDLPKKKHMEIALTYIHGIGRASARKILDEAEVPYNTNSDDLTDGDVAKIRKILEEEYHVEGDRRREVSMDSGSYRGLRHRKGLPCRGQRTSTNARTRKGPRRGAGIKRK